MGTCGPTPKVCSLLGHVLSGEHEFERSCADPGTTMAYRSGSQDQITQLGDIFDLISVELMDDFAPFHNGQPVGHG